MNLAAQGQKQKAGSGVIIRTRHRIKHHKGHQKRHEKGQPAFNDPLYQYLDNQVYNKEQHNFGPWVEQDRKSRQRNDRNKRHINLPTLTPALEQNQENIMYYEDINQPQEENIIPIFDRENRVLSLHQLRGVSLELRPSLPAQPPRFRREPGLRRQPFFRRSQVALPLRAIRTDISQGRRSNINYNYCMREQDSKIFNLKLRVKPPTPYMQLGVNEIKMKSTNKQLFKELKQHRLDRLK